MRRSLKSLIGPLVLVASALSLAAAGDATLIDAIKNRNLDEARALLKRGADVNAVRGDGATALHWASHLDDLAARYQAFCFIQEAPRIALRCLPWGRGRRQ